MNVCVINIYLFIFISIFIFIIYKNINKFIALLLLILYLILLLLLSSCVSTKRFKSIRQIDTRKNFVKDTEKKYDKPVEIKVWTYWDGNKSNMVNLCLDRIYKSCKISSNKYIKFIHIHLNKNNLFDYLDNKFSKYLAYNFPNMKKISLKSDLIRLYLLYNYGGIWLDASIYLFKHIDKVFVHDIDTLLNNGSYFVGLYNPNNNNNFDFPIIENNTLFCNKGNKLVKLWLDEMLKVKDFSDKTLNDYYKDNKLYYLKNLLPVYHYSYFCLFVVILKHGGIKSFDNVILQNCMDYNYFSYKSFVMEDFIYKNIEDFYKKYNKNNLYMVKFINNTRKYIDNNWENTKEDSIIKGNIGFL